MRNNFILFYIKVLVYHKSELNLLTIQYKNNLNNIIVYFNISMYIYICK